MTCYKSGGCGVYENRSCSECPASKPEYAYKNNTDESYKEFFEKYYKEHCQHGDVYAINSDGTLGEKIGTCSILKGK